MKKPIAFAFFCLVATLLHSQNAKVLRNAKTDSLRVLLAKAKNDTSKVLLYLQLSYQFSQLRNLDSVASTANNALTLSKRLNYTKGIAWSCNNLGGANQEQGYYDIAIGYHRTAIGAKLVLHDSIGLAGSYTNLGLIYLYKNALDSSFFYTQKSIELKEQKHDTAHLFQSYNNMGLCYAERDDYRNALIYYNKSLDICFALQNKGRDLTFELGRVYSNLGTAYYHLGMNNIAIRNYNKSWEYCKANDSIAGKYRFLNNMGNIYADRSDEERLNGNIAVAEKDYQLAIQKYTESILLKKKENDWLSMAESYLNLADLSKTSGHLQNAILYSDTALTVALKSENNRAKRNVYFFRSKIFIEKKDYKMSKLNFELYLQYSEDDSTIKTDDIDFKSNLRRNNFSELEKAELAVKFTELEAYIFQIQRLIFILSTVIILVGVFFSWRYIARKSKRMKFVREITLMPGQPTVFISYSWGESDHENWVEYLVNRMRNDKINVVLDKSHLKNGDNNLFFVEKAIMESDNVIMIFSPSYLQKTHDLNTGVGLEYNIILSAFRSEQFFRKKLICILRSGLPQESIPVMLRQTFLYDMRKDEDYETHYKELIRLILNISNNKNPSGRN